MYNVFSWLKSFLKKEDKGICERCKSTENVEWRFMPYELQKEEVCGRCWDWAYDTHIAFY